MGFGVEECKGISPQQLGEFLFLRPADSNPLNPLGVGVEPHHRVGGRIAVHVEAGVLPGDLVARAAQIECDDARDADVALRVGTQRQRAGRYSSYRGRRTRLDKPSPTPAVAMTRDLHKEPSNPDAPNRLTGTC